MVRLVAGSWCGRCCPSCGDLFAKLRAAAATDSLPRQQRPHHAHGVRYPNADAALVALQGTKTNIVAQIPAEPDPVKGTALIIIPDHDRLRPFTNQMLTTSLKQFVPVTTVDFVNNAASQDVRELADALVKNGTFQTVTIDERNDVINLPTTGADYVIAYQVRTSLPNNTGVWVAGWNVRRIGNPQAIGAAADAGTPAGEPRIASFVKSVREAALRLGGTSIAGKTSATLPAAANGTPAVASSGSGIIIDKLGGILTNAHVVNACTEPRITDTGNDHFKARIVVKDQANDLALLKVDHHWPQAATLRDDEPKLGGTAIVSGFPLSGLVASSMSVTAGTVSATAGPRDDSRLFQISAPVQPGNSGGPVLDVQGHVTGIVTRN